MQNKIAIYQIEDKQAVVKVQFENDTVWLTQSQMAELFDTTPQNITMHLKSIFKEQELNEKATCKDFLQVRKEGNRSVKRKQLHYSLDAIISVGYRVKSTRATQFRIWATQRLKDYLVQGYAINEKRLAEKQQEVEYLKTGIRILGRAIETKLDEDESEILTIFAKGLELLDDYDHKTLDEKGNSTQQTVYPSVSDYLKMIAHMYSDFKSDVFAKPKDESFESSVNQIRQSFADEELYPTIEEKAANLLYYIVKNHSFIDGNKRIAAACFLYFLERNKSLLIEGKPLLSNEALASLTLFIATSKSKEADIVKRFIISILNRNA